MPGHEVRLHIALCIVRLHTVTVEVRLHTVGDEVQRLHTVGDERLFSRMFLLLQQRLSTTTRYVLALERLIKRGAKFKRNVWLTFVPDEEIGGQDGMGKLLQSEIFKNQIKPVGLGLDEVGTFFGIYSSSTSHIKSCNNGIVRWI